MLNPESEGGPNLDTHGARSHESSTSLNPHNPISSEIRTSMIIESCDVSFKTSNILEFTCLYTHDVRRKAKRWKDGCLRFHQFNKRVMVYDIPRNFIGDTHATSDLNEGDELLLERGGALVQVGEQQSVSATDLTTLLAKRVPKPLPRALEACQRTKSSNEPVQRRIVQFSSSSQCPKTSFHPSSTTTPNKSHGSVATRPAKRKLSSTDHVPLKHIMHGSQRFNGLALLSMSNSTASGAHWPKASTQTEKNAASRSMPTDSVASWPYSRSLAPTGMATNDDMIADIEQQKGSAIKLALNPARSRPPTAARRLSKGSPDAHFKVSPLPSIKIVSNHRIQPIQLANNLTRPVLTCRREPSATIPSTLQPTQPGEPSRNEYSFCGKHLSDHPDRHTSNQERSGISNIDFNDGDFIDKTSSFNASLKDNPNHNSTLILPRNRSQNPLIHGSQQHSTNRPYRATKGYSNSSALPRASYGDTEEGPWTAEAWDLIGCSGVPIVDSDNND